MYERIYILGSSGNFLELLLQITFHCIQNIKSEDKPAVQAMEAADKMENVPKDLEKAKAVDPGLLTFGTAWAIGLFLRDSSGSNLVAAACDLLGSSTSYPTLLYRCCSLLFLICMIWNPSFLEAMTLSQLETHGMY